MYGYILKEVNYLSTLCSFFVEELVGSRAYSAAARFGKDPIEMTCRFRFVERWRHVFQDHFFAYLQIHFIPHIYRPSITH